MSTTTATWTAEQLFQSPRAGRCELVRGELIMMTPAGYRHGRIVSRLNARLEVFVEEHRLGEVTGGETGFLIHENPDTVRAPDVAFVTAARALPLPPQGYFQGPPDLAVEVLSPHDRAGTLLSKVYDWLDAGCREIWVVDPESRTVTVYRSKADVRVLDLSSDLTSDVVAGFKVAVATLFE